ncbi:MAG: TIGR03560 family F420-dependent LLM class oxidoreductase [Candidatus Bathyarchaeota archaeon]|nr:MAG: TIGR03560 family F420-dependent LLM class oxidoreductase [Candidatus Bathyarchaeota archaeon]
MSIGTSEDVWFEVHVPPEGFDFEGVKHICLKAEELGYDFFSVTDHFMNMRNPDGPGDHPLECWTTLAGLAAVTERIRIGSLVSCYAYRPPPVLAKMATTVDIISGGRLVFGIGAGWHETEFRGFLGRWPPLRERLRGLEETVQICKSMFTKERTTFHGRMFSVENVLNYPPPIQRPPTILVGGGGEKRTLRIAAKHADISHFIARDIDTLERKLKALKGHCRSVGRDFEEIRKGLGFRFVIGRDEEESDAKLRRLAEASGREFEDYKSRLGIGLGTPEKIAEDLGEYIGRGIGLISGIFPIAEDMELFSKRVIPLIN